MRWYCACACLDPSGPHLNTEPVHVRCVLIMIAHSRAIGQKHDPQHTLQCLFGNCKQGCDSHANLLCCIGELPKELSGTLLRNGPGLLEIGGKPLTQPLDGDGMVITLVRDLCNCREHGSETAHMYWDAKHASCHNVAYSAAKAE